MNVAFVFLLTAMIVAAFIMAISILAIVSPRVLALLLLKWLDLLS